MPFILYQFTQRMKYLPYLYCSVSLTLCSHIHKLVDQILSQSIRTHKPPTSRALLPQDQHRQELKLVTCVAVPLYAKHGAKHFKYTCPKLSIYPGESIFYPVEWVGTICVSSTCFLSNPYQLESADTFPHPHSMAFSVVIFNL